MTHLLRYAARTDRGLLRANNQDSVFAGDRLLVIADGMGGHAAGDVASRLVVAAFVDLDELPPGSDMVRPLTEATHEGNEAIAEMVDTNPELEGMGTTLTALLFDGPVVALAHVGDSRAYLYRNGVLHQISHDDTFVQSLVDDGRITADEAAHHPQRSLLLRALNGTEMDPSITLRETSPGDRFLICSDGLSDVVSPEAIADALAGSDPDSVADTLIQLALVGGGPDNVTVIVADVLETGSDGFGVPAGIDPEATGPMQPIHLTQRMPRIPLPPIPEEPAAKARYAGVGNHSGTLDDEDLGDDDLDDDEDLDDEDLGDDDLDDEDLDDADLDRVDDEVDGEEAHRHGPDDLDDDLAKDQLRAGPLAAVRASKPSPDRSARRVVAAPPRRSRYRAWALALAIAILAGLGLTGSYLWAGSKYFVGDNDDQVAVFRGVNGSLLGWKLASAQENSCATAGSACSPLKVGDLVQAARDQVTAGIPVATLADARAVMTRLTSEQLPPCPAAGAPTVIGTPASPSASSGAASSTAPSSSSASRSRSVATSTAAHTSGAVPGNPAPTTGAAVTVSPRRATTGSRTSGPPTAGPRTSAPRAGAGTVRTSTVRTSTVRTSTVRTSTVRTSTVRTSSVPPVPVTTTVTVTVGPLISGDVTAGQRLRGDQFAALLPGQPAGAATTPTRAPETKPIVPKPIATDALGSAAVGTAPITRHTAAPTRPTITVFTTVTTGAGAGATSGPPSSATPLVSPAAQPGVTCRPVS